MPKRNWLNVAVGLFFAFVCCTFTGFGALALPPAYLLIGWAFHVYRLAKETAIDWPNLAIVIGSLACFTLGFHLFCKWFVRTRNADWRCRRTLGIVGLMLLAFVAGISAIGVTHQTTWLVTMKERVFESGVRVASARTHASNNLKQLALGAHYFHDHKKSLPPGGTFDVQGRGLHGWQTMLLPYFDQAPLYQRIDFAQPWNAPRNAEFTRQVVVPFHNPAIDDREVAGYSLSHFAGNSHVLGAKGMTLKDITDGTSDTLLAGEVTGEFKPWAMPMNCRDPAFAFGTTSGFANVQGKTVLFVMADGSVRAVRPDIDSNVLRALATPRGGEVVQRDDLE
ncbi:MAG: DUF1559 domain-containing protein [Gemmataceae bacterium]|nr:DUF1559 domain-containing protein [Gemmataceae bacterium]